MRQYSTMSRRIDPFYSAKLAFKGLEEDIKKLDVASWKFANSDVIRRFTERDGRTGEIVQKVQILSDIPDEFERNAVRYLSEIRGTLDKAIHGAAQILGSISLRHSNFPFGDNEAQFCRQLDSENGPWRGIPRELHLLLKEIQPWPEFTGQRGGNELLAMLGRLSNPAKHQNVLMIDVHVDGLLIGNMSGSASFNRIQTIWNSVRNECEVFRLSSCSGEMQLEVPVFIAFNDTGVLAREPFTRILHHMCRVAQNIVLSIESKTSESLGNR